MLLAIQRLLITYTDNALTRQFRDLIQESPNRHCIRKQNIQQASLV